MKVKTLLKELGLIALCATLTWSIIKLFFSYGALDINLHDTYFVIDPSGILIIKILGVITIVYAIREACYKYRRRLQNLILIVVNFVLIVKLVILVNAAALFNQIVMMGAANDNPPSIVKGGLTIYPPLSALPKQYPPYRPHLPFLYAHLTQILTGAVIIFMLLLVLTAFFTGKNWHTEKHDQAL